MQRSTDRILTTHVGRLERPDHITRMMEADGHSRPHDPAFIARLGQAVTDVVRQQAETGIDVPIDATSRAWDAGQWSVRNSAYAS